MDDVELSTSLKWVNHRSLDFLLKHQFSEEVILKIAIQSGCPGTNWGSWIVASTSSCLTVMDGSAVQTISCRNQTFFQWKESHHHH